MQETKIFFSVSDPSQKLRRSESILASLAKNVEDFKDNIVRSVRNRVRSVRRHKSRKNSCLETTSVIERVDSLKVNSFSKRKNEKIV